VNPTVWRPGAHSRRPDRFGLFRNAIFTIADEMAVTIFRTAYSGVLKSGMDYSTALADGAGIVVAQGLTQPSHLGSIRRRWPASWRAPAPPSIPARFSS